MKTPVTSSLNLSFVTETVDYMREKSCYHKEFKHLIILEENQKKKGIKNMPMKFYDAKCETI